MRNSSVRLAAAAALLVFAAPPARGQGGPGVPGIGGAGPFVLMAPAVQKELKLTDAQTEKVGPTLRELAEKNRESMVALQGLEIRQRMVKARALIRALDRDLKSALELTPEQVKRFDQITLQMRRFEAFADPEVQSRLMLSDAQKGDVMEIAQGNRERMQEILKGQADDRPGTMQKLAALSKEMADKAVALLDDEQKAAWKAMTGAPFELQAAKAPND